jgi:hypothetical protein
MNFWRNFLLKWRLLILALVWISGLLNSLVVSLPGVTPVYSDLVYIWYMASILTYWMMWIFICRDALQMSIEPFWKVLAVICTLYLGPFSGIGMISLNFYIFRNGLIYLGLLVAFGAFAYWILNGVARQNTSEMKASGIISLGIFGLLFYYGDAFVDSDQLRTLFERLNSTILLFLVSLTPLLAKVEFGGEPRVIRFSIRRNVLRKRRRGRANI